MKKQLALLALISLSTVAANAQNMDSLKTVWSNPNLADTTRLRAMKQCLGNIQSLMPDSMEIRTREMLAVAKTFKPDQQKASSHFQAQAYTVIANTYMMRGRQLDALPMFREALQLHQAEHDTNGVGTALNGTAVAYTELGKLDTAETIYNQAIELFTANGNEEGIGKGYNGIGTLKIAAGDLAAATTNILESIKHNKKANKKDLLLAGYGNLAMIMSQQQDHDKAIEYLSQGLAIAEEINNKRAQAHFLSDIGASEIGAGRLEEGIRSAERAVDLARETQFTVLELRALKNIAMAYGQLGDQQKAFDVQSQAMEVAKKVQDPNSEAMALSGMASACSGLGRNAEAARYGERSLALLKQTGTVEELFVVSGVLRQVYKELGQYDKAYAMYELSTQMNDSIMNEEAQRGVLRQEYAFENHKRAFADSLEHATQTELGRLEHAAVLSKEKNRRNIFLISAVLLLAIAALLYSLVVRSRRATTALQAKNEEITRTQNQLVIAEKQREAEQVRTQIARDIHDELGGDLTKVALLSAEIARRMERTPEEVPALLQSLGRVSREANAALKDIVWSVDPAQDTWQGLVNHAEVYSNRILEGSNMRSELQFEFKGPDAMLDPASKQNIFLVLKEALNNAVKHAHATLVQVRLSTSPSGYELAVLDNGTGFVVGDEGSESHGLRNMRARAEALQAALSLNSSAQGTHLELKGAISI